MNDSDKLWNELCCCGDDHTVKQGGSHINLVQLRKLAKWPYMTSVNFLVPRSKDYPLANAVVCDLCLEEKREIRYAMAGEPGNGGHARYYRVPIGELEEPEFYWPEHHPDKKLLMELVNGKTIEISQEEINEFITQGLIFNPDWRHSGLLSEEERMRYLKDEASLDDLKKVARYILVHTENLSFTAYLFDKADGEPERTKEFNMPAVKKLRELYQKVRDVSQQTLDISQDVHEMENLCLEIGADPL